MLQALNKDTATKLRTALPLCSFASFVVSSLLLLAGCGGPPKHPTWKNATGAEHHERLMWQALRDADWSNVEYHLAPAFVGVDSRGQSFDRAGWMELWKSQRVKEFSLSEIQVQPEGADLVITYVLRLESASPAGQPARTLRAVSVWQEIKGRWILTVSSLTSINGA
jgi:ketosteroid isomerase-like protein